MRNLKICGIHLTLLVWLNHIKLNSWDFHQTRNACKILGWNVQVMNLTEPIQNRAEQHACANTMHFGLQNSILWKAKYMDYISTYITGSDSLWARRGICTDATHCEWCYGWSASPGTNSWSDNRATPSHNSWCYRSPHVCVSQSCCSESLGLPVTRLLVASNLHTVWQTSSSYNNAEVR